MKRSMTRLLIAVLLILTVFTALTACDLSGEFTVTIKDGETTLKTLTFKKDEPIVIDLDDNDFLKPGYEVDALYTDAALTAKFEGDITATADLTLYVKYEPRPFKIIVIDDPNSTTYRSVDVTYGGTYTITEPTRAGYLFLGYTHLKDGTPATFPLSGTYTQTNTISISAQWKKLASITVYDELTDEQIGSVIYADKDGKFTLPAVSTEKPGYTFGGYAIPGVTLTKQADGSYTGTVTTDGDMQATLKWNEIPSYRLDVQGLYGSDVIPAASYKTGETFTLPAAPTRDGYRFVGYTVNGQPLTATEGSYTFAWSEDTVVVANWVARVYITLIDEITRTELAKIEVVDGAYDLTAHNGTDFSEGEKNYTFLGFTLGLNGTAFPASATDYEGGSVTVYRDWDGADKIYVTVHAVGANKSFAAIEIVDGAYAPLTDALAELADYYFLGYYTDAECTVAFANSGAADADVTVYAKYHPIITITVYNADGSPAGITATVQKDGSFVIPAPEAREGYVFDRYTIGGMTLTKQADGSHTGTYTGTAPLSATAVFTAIPSFNWSVDANGGAFASGAVTSGTAYESTAVTLPTPVSDGFNFLGYYYGDGIMLVKDGDSYILPAFADVGVSRLTLVAKWELQTDNTGWQKNEAGETIGYYREENGGELIHVFLTGETFWFGTSPLTFGGDTNAIEAKTADGKYGFMAKTPGTFTMTRNGITLKCRVEYAVTTAGAGTDTTGRAPVNFKGTIDTVLDAGHKNFMPDIVGGTVSLDKIPLKEVTVMEGDTPIVNTPEKIYYTVLPDGKIDFSDELIGKTLTITYTPKYAMPEDIASGEALATVTVKLNSGVNVYTNDELYDAYSDTTVTVINILRNITAAMQPEHCAHAHPASCDCKVFDAVGSDANPVPVNEYKHGVYTRNYTAYGQPLTVNGNCYTIDGSKLPKIDGRIAASAYDGLFEGTGYSSVNVQIGIFTCRAGYDTSSAGTQSPEVTFNDLYIIGNFDGDSTKTEGKLGENQLILGSMSFDGFVVRSGYLTLNNVTMLHMHKAIHSTGFAEAPYKTTNDEKAAYEPKRLETKVILTDVRILDSFANALFAWGQVQAELYNCEIGQCSGPAIVFSDTDITKAAYDAGYGSKLTIGADTTVKNYVTGGEAWFQAYGVSGFVSPMEQQINGLLSSNGLPVVSKKNGYFNLVLAVNAASDSRFPASYATGYADHYGLPCIDLVFEGATNMEGGLSLFSVSGGADPCIPVAENVYSEAILTVDPYMTGEAKMQLVIQLFAPPAASAEEE